MAVALNPGTIAVGKVINVAYSGQVKSITLPPGRYKLECWGAEGGTAGTHAGGKGGYSVGELNLVASSILYLRVGGRGIDDPNVTSKDVIPGGFNGGGSGISWTGTTHYGASGGGGTDICIGADSHYARVIVAGGGGGGSDNAVGGAGGGVSGVAGSEVAGTATSGSGFGAAAKASYTGGECGGGGGGWYGGTGGTAENNSGGGGSGYVFTASTKSQYPSGCKLTDTMLLSNASTKAGNTSFIDPETGSNATGRTGNGYIRITVLALNNTGAGTYYIANNVGSAALTIPSKLVKGDYIHFNITNSNESTGYKGTILKVTIPTSCKVKINAYGSRGAYGNLYTSGLTDSTRSGNGAYCYGTFSFKKGDELLILVGQHGKDAMISSSSIKDQTSGGGGGATIIAKRVASGGMKFIGCADSGSTAYNGWLVQALIVAAGGNGSRDNGYSETGTIYDGLGHTTAAEALQGSTMQSGTFSLEAGSTSSNNSSYTYGRSFLSGGLGSMYSYSRTTNSLGGFGCGGSNGDDAEGGGGGGWVGGAKGVAAKSYINSTLGSNIGSSAGYNNGDGYVTFEILDVGPTPKVAIGNGTYRNGKEAYVYVDSSLKFRPVKDIYVMDSSGKWRRST